MNPKETHQELIANKIIKNLQKRQMEGFYCPTSAEAVALATSLLQEGDTVTFGGSMTLVETGMLEALRSNDHIELLDRDKVSSLEERDAIFAKAFTADAYFMSSNAITLEGELLNIDGTGNRVAALTWGPKKVILLVGMNKVAADRKEAYERIKNIATPLNCLRLNITSPCSVTGTCQHCTGAAGICAHTVLTERSMQPNRIKVILIGENLGY